MKTLLSKIKAQILSTEEMAKVAGGNETCTIQTMDTAFGCGAKMCYITDEYLQCS